MGAMAHAQPLVERTVAGCNVAVGGREGAPTLVLLHGHGATWRSWGPFLPLVARRFHVVAVDLPGFGGSPPPPGTTYDLDAVAAGLEEACIELELGAITLVGHSMGGGLAAIFAAHYPNRVRRLVLVAPAGFAPIRMHGPVTRFWSHPHALRAARLSGWLAMPGVAVSTRARQVTFRGLFRDHSVLTRADALSLLRGWTQAHSLGPAGEVAVREHARERMADITAPTLLVWGDDDRVVRPVHADELARELPDAQLVWLRDIGHMPMFECPELLASTIAEFASGDGATHEARTAAT
jgi:pimeloyl-ACP methyl ester carboxylesterase